MDQDSGVVEEESSLHKGEDLQNYFISSFYLPHYNPKGIHITLGSNWLFCEYFRCRPTNGNKTFRYFMLNFSRDQSHLEMSTFGNISYLSFTVLFLSINRFLQLKSFVENSLMC